MTLETVLGQPALFRLTDSAELPSDLSLRERRLLVGALNFHAIMAPERELVIHAYDGSWDSLPRTTDDTTFDGMSRAYRNRLFTVHCASTVTAESRTPTPSEAMSSDLVSRTVRHIRVSRDDVLEHDPPRELDSSPVRRALRAVRSHAPLLYDEARDIELLRHRRAITHRAKRREYEAEFERGGIHEDNEIVVAPSAPPGAPRAVLIGMHWFELGGAERWAFESVRLVREAGFLPIVLTNRDSHQPWISRAELDEALIIPFSEATVASQTPGVEELLRGILVNFDVRGVIVHHNQWLYDRLSWIRRSRPDIPVLDSTHIIEYRGGGYPLSSVRVEESISRHHVISPSLARWMTDTQGLPAEKVVMAPLGGLTMDLQGGVFRARGGDEPFTVAFIGRMARQKAPEVFIAMAHRLKRMGRRFKYIVHGDGEMASWVDDLIAAYGLEADIVRRDSSIPVHATLGESHLLVVTSHNEGLTLTTFEAIAHGLPVLSTDVGAQSDIIPRGALIPRNPHRAVRQGALRVDRLAEDEAARRALWHEELETQKKLLSHRSARDWLIEEVRSW